MIKWVHKLNNTIKWGFSTISVLSDILYSILCYRNLSWQSVHLTVSLLLLNCCDSGCITFKGALKYQSACFKCSAYIKNGMQFPPQKLYFIVHFINLLTITITKSMNGSNYCNNSAAFIYFLNIESLKMTTTFSDEAPLLLTICWQRKTNIHIYSLFMESTTSWHVFHKVSTWSINMVFTEFEKVLFLWKLSSPRLHLFGRKYSNISKIKNKSTLLYFKIKCITVLQSLVSHYSSEIILKLWFGAQETSLIIINVKNSCAVLNI